MLARWFLAIAALTISGPASAQPRFNLYDLGDLGSLEGLTTGYSVGMSVNNSGQVAGSSLTPDLYSVGFRTGPAGLGSGASSLLGQSTDARAINTSGQVIGSYQVGPDTGAYYRLFRTSPNGSALDPGADLGTLLGGTPIGADNKAYGINASGQVVGQIFDSAGVYHGFRTSPNGRISDPGADLGPAIIPTGINDSGQTTGNGDHAFRTTPNGLPTDPGADLGTLGGSYSYGMAINASGQVTGWSERTVGGAHAFRTTPTGRVSDPGTDLGVLPAYGASFGNSINALGHVVGFCSGGTGPTTFRAFVDTDQMYDLNSLITPGTGWYLRFANSINDNDWITGQAIVGGGYRGFLLIPVDNDPGTRTPIAGVPEPSSLALGAAAAVGGWLIRRRRSRPGRQTAAA